MGLSKCTNGNGKKITLQFNILTCRDILAWPNASRASREVAGTLLHHQQLSQKIAQNQKKNYVGSGNNFIMAHKFAIQI